MQKFNVTGMSCAACSARVEKAVSSLDNVSSCAVNLLTNSMQVDGKATTDEIIAAVRAVGYNASVVGEKSEQKVECGKEKIAARLVSSIVFLVVLMYFSMGYNMLNLPLPPFFTDNPATIALAQMLLAVVVMVINQKFFISGFKGIIRGAPNMDTLVALGSAASFAYSTVILFLMIKTGKAHHLHNLYFESCAMILTLITVGKLLEARAKGKTSDALSALMKLTPKVAALLIDGKEVAVPIEQVKVGDVFVLRPGDSVPVDGVVIEGISAVNESSLTGESIPVDKKEGDSLYSATLNQSGYLVARATKVGEDTTFAQIIKMVSDASATKAPIAKLADKVSGIFVPIVIAIAIITFAAWMIAGENVGYALNRSISVLVISCPCALGLATPVAIMVGSGVGAKHGILFKTATSLEITGKSQIVVLDKTGTITKGEPSVTDVFATEGTEESKLLELAYSMEQKSEHPLSKAVVAYARKKEILARSVEDFAAISGKGISAIIDKKSAHAGNREYVGEFCQIPSYTLSRAEKCADEGKTPLFFEFDGRFLGVIAVADTIKEDSAEAMKVLHKMGIKTVMLTGDNEKTAKAIATQVGIEEVVAEVLPDGKEKVIRDLSEKGTVCMIGDGINDAPALTRAHVGMAIGAGTDVACDSADVVLMKNSLSDAVSAIKLSRATLKNIKENLFWAFFYNAIGIPLAAGVFAPLLNWELNPMFGAAAMSLSSFCVVSNALRLNLVKLNDKRKKENVMKTIKIDGMMCPHCEGRVKGLLESLAQVTSADVSHTRGDAKIEITADIDNDTLKKLIEDAGYKVIDIK